MSYSRTPSPEIEIPFTAPQGKQAHTVLSVRITHARAGTSYFSGKHYPSATRLSLTPETITTTKDGFKIRSSVLMSGDQWESGFFVILDSADRKNPHAIKRYFAILSGSKAIQESIRDAYEHRDGAGLQTIANDIRAMADQSAPKKRATTAPLPAPLTA